MQQPGAAEFRAFIPSPLPPSPPVKLEGELAELLERASRELGRLDGVTVLLPDPQLFMHMYGRKEAVLSSQIEGTQSSLSDLLLFEGEDISGADVADIREVQNYAEAMEYGLERISGGFPLSMRLIREIHKVLMRGVRGGTKDPGEFRRSQNWVGGSRPGNARFVPPPPHEVMPALSNLETYLHDRSSHTPLLIKAGIAHAQFETIHPFLDGNGRVGRLLITFMLCAGGALSQPLLYLSLYLKARRSDYYEYLQRIRTHGDWEGWLLFYLEGVETVARQAMETAKRVVDLFEGDQRRIHSLGSGVASTLRLHDLLRRRAIISIPKAIKETGLAKVTVAAAVRRLEELGIVGEITGKQRNRLYAYEGYMNLLNEGTEP